MKKAIVILSISLVLWSCISNAQNEENKLQIKNGTVYFKIHSNDIDKECSLQTKLNNTTSSIANNVLKNTEHIIITKQKIYNGDNLCTVINSYKLTSYGLHWDVYVNGGDNNWTTPIETSLDWTEAKGINFWTTWSDNQLQKELPYWVNPFLSAPLSNFDLMYGGKGITNRDAFVIPIATSFFQDKKAAVSFSESPGDTILDMHLLTDTSGMIAFKHFYHRICKTNTIHFSMDIIVHEDDWRSALGWYYKQYKEYFLPKEPKANEIAGCGSYSSYEGKLDAEKYKKMAYTFNWKASLDFPYMSQFIPPVANDTMQWKKIKQNGVVIADGLSSIKRLSDYSTKFLKMGFYTLSYFNVTEAGSQIKNPAPPRIAKTDADLWKDPNDFVYYKMKNAVVLYPEWKALDKKNGFGVVADPFLHNYSPIFSWDRCIVMDPGEPTFQQHLLEQARKHIEKIPASSGIAIDRLDWLRLYNANRDDGISYFDNQITCSIISSWKDIMSKLGPLMHKAHKVIFCNPLYYRIDFMKDIDGIYDEFGQHPQVLARNAQMAMFKPYVAWTESVEDFKPNPDTYFQSHLFMGAFLTDPVQGNDHTIRPDSTIDKYYLDYGSMLNAIKGREWLLYPHIISVADDAAKANIFKVKNKIIIPVVQGEDNANVQLHLQLPEGLMLKNVLQVKVLYPGAEHWQSLQTINVEKQNNINVQLHRGCAMISLE